MTRLLIPLLACLLGALSAVHGAAATLSSAQHVPQAQVDDSHQLHAIQHLSKISGRTMPPPIQVRNEDQTTRVKRADDGLTYHYDGYLFVSYFNDPTNTCSTVPASSTFTGIGVCRYSQKITEVMIDTTHNRVMWTYSYYNDDSCTQLTSTYVSQLSTACNYYNTLAGWSQNVFLPEGTPAVGGFLSYTQYSSDAGQYPGNCSTDLLQKYYSPVDLCLPEGPTMRRSTSVIIGNDNSIYTGEFTFSGADCSNIIATAYISASASSCSSNYVQEADIPSGTTLGQVYLKESFHNYDENSTCESTPTQVKYHGGLEVCLNQEATSSFSYALKVSNTVVKVNTSFTTLGCDGEVSYIETTYWPVDICNNNALMEVESSIVPPSADGILRKNFITSDQCNVDGYPLVANWFPTNVCLRRSMHTCANNVGTFSYYNNEDCTDSEPYYLVTGRTNCENSDTDDFMFNYMENNIGSHSVTCTSPWTPEPSLVPTQLPTARPSLRPTVTPSFKPTQKVARKPTVKPSKQPTKKPIKKPTLAPTKRPTLRPTKKPNRKPSQTTASVDSASVSASASASDVKMSMFDTLMAGIRGLANI